MARETPDKDPLISSNVAIGLIMLAFFLLVLTVLLWRDGKFDGLWPSKGAVIGNEPRGWMMGGKEKGKARDLSPPASDTSVFDADKDRFEAAPPPAE